MKTDGFSLLEVLLAAIIFVLTIAGIFTALNTVRIPVSNKENQLTAMQFGKQVTEALYSQVNGTSGSNYYFCNGGSDGLGNCVDFSLYPGPHLVPNTTVQNQGLNWPTAIANANSNGCADTPCLQYTISCADGLMGAACATDVNNPARYINLYINWPSLP